MNSVDVHQLHLVSTPYTIADARHLPQGNWFKGNTPFMEETLIAKEYAPTHVYVPHLDLRLYFWLNGDLKKWFCQYAVLTGDIEANRITVCEMYTAKRIKELNKYQENLGDDIVKDAYTYTLGNTKWWFVQRFFDIQLRVVWRKSQ